VNNAEGIAILGPQISPTLGRLERIGQIEHATLVEVPELLPSTTYRPFRLARRITLPLTLARPNTGGCVIASSTRSTPAA
jgi:hypothetical protein